MAGSKTSIFLVIGNQGLSQIFVNLQETDAKRFNLVRKSVGKKYKSDGPISKQNVKMYNAKVRGSIIQSFDAGLVLVGVKRFKSRYREIDNLFIVYQSPKVAKNFMVQKSKSKKKDEF